MKRASIGLVAFWLALAAFPVRGGGSEDASPGEELDGYAGLGFGVGAGWSPYRSGFSLMVKLGAAINPYLLAGVEFSHFGVVLVGTYHIDAMLTWFPASQRTIFAKIGAGMALFTNPFEDGEDAAGFDSKVGLGYERQVGEHGAFGVEVSYRAAFVNGTMVNYIVGMLVFTWY